MNALTEPACAKLNLTLDVLGRRPDGYHDLRMVMVSVSLCDEVTLTRTNGTGIRAVTGLAWLPTDRKNLAVSAALAFQAATGVNLDGLRIEIHKQIPVCAGTAGGSSDAAATLRGLNALCGTGLSRAELAEIGEAVGSDVPYCVLGGTMRAEGRGERLTPLPALPMCSIVLCKPSFSVSTPELFRRIDGIKLRCHPDSAGMERALADGDLAEIARRMYNVFEDVLPAQQRKTIDEIKASLTGFGALGACLSGTGPTVFGLFDDGEKAQAAAEELRAQYPDTFLTKPV